MIASVVVDTREDEEFVKKLTRMGLHVLVDTLPTGDILIGDLVIERKTIEDLRKSVFDKRLRGQSIRMCNLPEGLIPALLIEGKWNSLVGILKRAHEGRVKKGRTKKRFDWYTQKQTLLSMYRSVVLDWDVKVFRSECLQETCEIIKNLATKKPKDEAKLHALRESAGKELTLDEQQQFILEGFQGIGPTKADRILTWAHSLEGVFQFFVESGDYYESKNFPSDLKQNSKIWAKILEVLEHQYKGGRKDGNGK